MCSSDLDLLKLPFPVDPSCVTDHAERVAACREVTDTCSQPWALLSGGGSFESFEAQVIDSREGGASGFMVGRALWAEAARATGAERDRLLAEVVLPRWRRLESATA